ncbi:MAG: DUF6069 family protein [Anaerolineales bacterium]
MNAYSLRRLCWAGPAATLLALLADEGYYFATRSLGEQYLLPQDGNLAHSSPMPVLLPILAILAAGLAATVFFALLTRFSPAPASVFLSVAITALVLSFGAPFNLPNSPLMTKLLLSGMQVIAAVFISGGILWMSHKKKQVP